MLYIIGCLVSCRTQWNKPCWYTSILSKSIAKKLLDRTMVHHHAHYLRHCPIHCMGGDQSWGWCACLLDQVMHALVTIATSHTFKWCWFGSFTSVGCEWILVSMQCFQIIRICLKYSIYLYRLLKHVCPHPPYSCMSTTMQFWLLWSTVLRLKDIYCKWCWVTSTRFCGQRTHLVKM